MNSTTSPQPGNENAKPVSRRVVEKVAAATDSRPEEVGPLFERVNPDCLDALFEDVGEGTSRLDGSVSFPLDGCEVVVWASGWVDVNPGDVTPCETGDAAGGNVAESSE